MVQATIVYHQGSEVVDGFHTIVELDDSDGVRVWYSDPYAPTSSNYVDYPLGRVTEVIA